MRSIDWDKTANDYFNEIVSPFSKGVSNPIFRLLNAVPGHERKRVLELGCGTGTLLSFLSRHFNQVVGVDISKKMIHHSSIKCAKLNNVSLHVMDMLNINKLKEDFDVITCVNSIIMPNIVKINTILKRAFNLLKKNGWLIGIFPSFDSLIHQALITYDKEFVSRKDRVKARRATNRIITKRLHDYCYGFVYAKELNSKQKHFFDFELNYRLKKAGFRCIKISKVYYPWSLLDDPKSSRFDDGVCERLWDWVVTARK